MITRFLMLIPVALGSTVFLSGAWPGPFGSPAQKPETSFVAQTIALDPDVIGAGLTSEELVAKAIAKLDWKTTQWLRTKIRQTVVDPESTFVSDGFLQRGPNHCARLELDVTSAGRTSRLLTVSDGEVVVRVIGTTENTPETLPSNAASREAHLGTIGCGGPLTVLRELQPYLKSATLQTGMRGDVPVIQIKADVTATPLPGFATAVPARFCYVYLDAGTLWPACIEWWGTDKRGNLHFISRIEFLDPQINHALSLEECSRMFSYQPAQ